MMSADGALALGEARRNRALAKAKRILGKYTIAELGDASVTLHRYPDYTNPSGYWDTWVILERPILNGPWKWARKWTWKTRLYFGQSVEFDDENVRAVLAYGQNLLAAIRAE